MIWTNRCVTLTTRKIVILVGRKSGGKWEANDPWAIVGAIIRVVLIVGIFAMMSCSAQYHLKRAIAKDPTILADTIVRIDTAVVTNERIVSDTLVIRDTIMRESVKDGVVVKVQRIHDTIRVDVICPPDTIRVTKDIPVERIIYKDEQPKIWKRLMLALYIVLCITIIAFINRLIK